MVLLAGCTLAPKYDRPEAPVPKTWPSGPSYQDTKQAPQASQLPWRDFITDPRLREVIAVALANNRDLRVTGLNVEKAKAMFGINRASLLPIVNATGNWYQERVPADLSSSGKIYTAEKYSVNLGLAAWEIDFFGRIRSLKDAALEQYLATDEARRSAQILLVATVTQAYLALAADREALQLVASTLEAQEAAYNMIRKRHEVGMASELDLRRSQTQVETARGDVARYTQLVAQDENGLNLLVGSSVRPDLLPRDLSGVTLPGTSPPDCPPTCCSDGRTFWRRNTSSKRPMPISAQPARLFSPGFRLRPPSERPAQICPACSREAPMCGRSRRRL